MGHQTLNRYQQVIEHIFHKKYDKKRQKTRVPFIREDLATACVTLGFDRIKNLGDIPYSFRFRTELPLSITSTAPSGTDWIIVGTGTASYEFRLACPGKLTAAQNRQLIKIPDATPEIVKMYAPGKDEQALLTRVRYNRLIDLFSGLSCYSIQNHLRTTVENVGQIEVDEIYMGLNKKGAHFVLPCQAKSPEDSFGIAQVLQDLALCSTRYPNATCLPIALQFKGENDVAVLRLSVNDDHNSDQLEFSVVEERHYRLVPRSEITVDDLTLYNEGEID